MMRGWLLTFLILPLLFTTAQTHTPQPTEMKCPDGYYMKLADIERQNNGWSCGPHVAARILSTYGKDKYTYKLLKRQALHRTNGQSQYIGVHPATLGEMINDAGVKAEVMSLTLEELLNLVEEGRPVPVLIQSPSRPLVRMHWVIITGLDRESESIIVYNSDSNKARRLTYDRFEELWGMRDTSIFLKAMFPFIGLSSRTAIVLEPLESPEIIKLPKFEKPEAKEEPTSIFSRQTRGPRGKH